MVARDGKEVTTGTGWLGRAPEARAVRKIMESQVDEVKRQAYAQIAKAKYAVEGVSTELQQPRDHLRAATFEDLVRYASADATLSGWAAWFNSRYLDTGAPDRERT